MDLGTQGSPWQTGLASVNGNLLGGRIFDVVVVGAGIFGTSSALLSARAGMRTALIDAGDPLAISTAANSTGKVSVAMGTRLAKIASGLGETSAVAHARAVMAGMEMVEHWAGRWAPKAGLAKSTQVVYATDDQTADELERTAELSIAAGVRANSECDVAFLVEEPMSAWSFPDQLSMHPGFYLQGLLQECVQAGVELTMNSRVLGIDEFADQIELTTENGRVAAHRVIVGSHYPFLNRGLHFAHLKAIRHFAVVVKTTKPVPPVMTYRVTEPSRSARIVRDKNEEVLVVGEGVETGSIELAQDESDHYWEELVEWADQQYGVRDVVMHWAAQDTDTPDGAPFVGRITPGDNRIYLATGFGGWGLATATIAADEIVRDMQGLPCDYLSLWSPHRLGSLSSTARLAKWQAEVGTKLVSGMVHSHEGGPEDLRPGEAGIFGHGLHQVAAHHSASGELLKVSARCTHLGCTVAWNAAEETWDCPCHGSRFGLDGEVLEGPATRPLRKIDE